MIQFTVNTETKTICFGESDSLEEVQYIIDMFPGYTITPYLAFDELDKLTVGDMCQCNPKNGGNGFCGCTIANTLIKK